MKKRILFLTTLMLAITCCLNCAFAGRLATAVGTTTGGTLGKTTCAGYMTYQNYAAAGADTTTASTSTQAKGTVKAVAKIHYANSAGSRTSSSPKTDTNSTYVQASVTAPSGAHGYKSSSSHSYTSDSYGSWSDSLSYEY